MDNGETVRLENWTDIQELVAMSIGTDKGRWWADPTFGSELWILKEEGKLDGTSAGKVRSCILESLAWLKTDGLARSIACTAERTGKNEIRYAVTVVQPDGSSVFIKDVWYGIG